nr:hypothetical protein CFP56_56979 [Quercus suber]
MNSGRICAHSRLLAARLWWCPGRPHGRCAVQYVLFSSASLYRTLLRSHGSRAHNGELCTAGHDLVRDGWHLPRLCYSVDGC